MRAIALALPLTLAACQGPVPEPAFDPAVGPGLELAMTGGLDEADHVEVAPGVFMPAALYESGEIRYVPQVDPGEALLSDVHAPQGFSPDGIERQPTSGGASYCYDYDSEYYYDSTSSGSLFGGDTTWYGYATAYSYDYSYPTGYSYDYDYASAYVYTYAPAALDYVYAYAYIYINGDYAGYVTDYVTGGTYAYAYTSWEAECGDMGFLDVTVYTYHYGYLTDTLPSGLYTRESLSISNTVSAQVTCCP